MRRLTRHGVALTTVLALGLSLAPALAASADCMPRASCPMMDGAKKTGHCQPTDAFVADCCAMQGPPADTAPPARVAVGSSADLLATALVGETPTLHEPEGPALTRSPLAGKLHSIGRHTLFQSFLS